MNIIKYDKIFEKYYEETESYPRFLWLHPDDGKLLLQVIMNYVRAGSGRTYRFQNAEVRLRPWVKKGEAFLTLMDLENPEEMSNLGPAYSIFKLED